MNRKGGGGQGQALAEFALVFPVFLLLALILVDFARGIFIYSVISDASREGARYAIVHGTLATSDNPPASGPGTADPDGSSNVIPAAEQFMFGLDKSALKIAVCWGFGCSIAADCSGATNTALGPVPDVPVTVRSCYRFLPITSSFIRQGTIPLAAQATLTITH